MRKRKKVIITISAVILAPVLLLALTVFLLEFYAPERIVESYKTELTEETEAVETSVTTVPETEGTRTELILSTRAEPNDKIQAAMDCIKNEYIV